MMKFFLGPLLHCRFVETATTSIDVNRGGSTAYHSHGIPRSSPAQYGYPARIACNGQHELERGQARNPLQLTAIRQHESPHSNWIPCVPACRIESTAFLRHPRNRIRNRNPPGSPRPPHLEYVHHQHHDFGGNIVENVRSVHSACMHLLHATGSSVNLSAVRAKIQACCMLLLARCGSHVLT
jgi:hypothetical protein